MSYVPLRSEWITEPEELQTSTKTPKLIAPKILQPAIRNRRRHISARTPRKSPPADFPIIVHSHLCWDWVWQRPQQFLSRLSRRHRILFVETVGPDPRLAYPHATFRPAEHYPNITILRMQFPAWAWHDGRLIDHERRRILRRLLRGPLKGQFDHPAQWFYDPMAVTAFAGHMREILTVYDCMDELSKFRFAPPEIRQRETQLLARAEIVFTGGRQLFEAKAQNHSNCHFYGCGVDVDHFGKARQPQTVVPPDLANLPKPVLGYFGVVDERLDYDLLARLADAFPHGSVAVVGPVMKVEDTALPRRANLHWLGKKEYADLPAICKGFDVCLMPFALNEATEFINPTKTLEYMATGRPVVSTAITDVVKGFSHIVDIAHSSGAFIDACRQAAAQPDPDKINQGLHVAADHSWDSIVNALEQHMEDALLQKVTRLA